MRDDTLHLGHIGQSIELVEQYLAGVDGDLAENRFYGDLRTQDAVIRRLETLADAAQHLSDGLKTRHLSIPWRQIADFRNVLAHAYTDIRLDQVWQVIVDDLPHLKDVVNTELGRSQLS